MRASLKVIHTSKVCICSRGEKERNIFSLLLTFVIPLFYVFLHLLDSYIIKLFDRSVDLAQFNTNTPLYPICRAWMRNNPSVREPAAYPSPTHSMEEEVRPYSLG